MNNRVYLYNTGSYARERLVTMLASDRIGCNPDFIDGLRHTIKNELERYLSVKESDIDIHVKEKMLIAYIPLAGSQDDNTDNRYEHKATSQGSVNYEAIEEGSAELKTVQS